MADGFKELDVVRLKSAIKDWPRGIEGTIVHMYGSTAMLEISDSQGRGLDFPIVRLAGVELVQSAATSEEGTG